MNNLAIVANKLSKAYLIRRDSADPKNRTLQEDIIKLFKIQKTVKEYIWALRDLSFEIKQGETTGIIGHNGAGKSTLLKILSRITEPSSGYADIYGRIGSLLEVGTGFHSELTGKENIYLSGSVLGMTKVEIRRNFDEIIDFSGIEKFLDTPVKRYSSGMQVRLAFSVAAHLDHEILLIDEVLAVGDAEFQKKCLRKMDEVAHTGRTILFVSHNMSHIQKLCQETLVIDKGRLFFQGDTHEAINKYLSRFEMKKRSGSLKDTPRKKGFGIECRFTDCTLKNSEYQSASMLKFGETFSVLLEIASPKSMKDLEIVLSLESTLYSNIVKTLSGNQNMFFKTKKDIPLPINVEFDDIKLNPGEYYFSISIVLKGEVIDQVENAISFTVLKAFEESYMPFMNGRGILATKPKWN